MVNNSAEAIDIGKLLVENRMLSDRLEALQQTVANLAGSVATLERQLMNCNSSVGAVRAELMSEIRHKFEHLVSRAASSEAPCHGSTSIDQARVVHRSDDSIIREVTELRRLIDADQGERLKQQNALINQVRTELTQRLGEIGSSNRNELQKLQSELTTFWGRMEKTLMEKVEKESKELAVRIGGIRSTLPEPLHVHLAKWFDTLTLLPATQRLVQLGWISGLGERLYRSEGCFTLEDYHKRCDGAAPVMALIRTTRGSIFGAVSIIATDSGAARWADDSTRRCFLFLLNSQSCPGPRKVQLRQDTQAVVVDKESVPPGTHPFCNGLSFDLVAPSPQYGITDVSLFDGSPDGKYKLAAIEVWTVLM